MIAIILKLLAWLAVAAVGLAVLLLAAVLLIAAIHERRWRRVLSKQYKTYGHGNENKR